MDLYSAVVIMNMMLIQCEAIGQDLIRFNKSNLISQTKESGAVYRGLFKTSAYTGRTTNPLVNL